MKLKTLAVGLCTIALLAGCGAKGDDAKSEKEDKTIRIGASVTPHAEILKHVKPALEKKGYKVEIEEFTDYVKPNQALVDDELDANFFQHKPYLVDWAKKANVSDKLTSVFAVHFAFRALFPLTTAKSTSGRLVAQVSACISIISTFLLYALISCFVASTPLPSFRVIIPLSASSFNARPPLVGSFGTEIFCPSATSFNDV